MIAYLVSPTYLAGVEEAHRRGWIQLAANRFATPARHDMRLVTRMADLVAAPGPTIMMRVIEYDAGPIGERGVEWLSWFGREGERGQKDEFDSFVASGRGRWVEDVDAVAEGRNNVQDGREVSRVGSAAADVF